MNGRKFIRPMKWQEISMTASGSIIHFSVIFYILCCARLLVIIISCLGLLGMAVFSTQTRMREIAIRKAYGAMPANILLQISWSHWPLSCCRDCHTHCLSCEHMWFRIWRIMSVSGRKCFLAACRSPHRAADDRFRSLKASRSSRAEC